MPELFPIPEEHQKELAKIGTKVDPQITRCLQPGCNEEGSPSSIKRHMEKEHEYCKKCKLFFDCWNDHTLHKIGSTEHNACLVCGIEYKRIGAMQQHVTTMHPKNQNIPCTGCGEIFARASDMIAHLETNSCKVVSAAQFKGHLQQKYIIRATLEGRPGALQLSTYKDAHHDDDLDGGVTLVSSRAPTQSVTGESLLEDDAATASGAQTPLQGAALEPERKANPKQQRLGERWPELPSAAKQKTPAVITANHVLSPDAAPSSSGGVRLSQASMSLSKGALSQLDASFTHRTGSAWGAGSSRAGPPSTIADGAATPKEVQQYALWDKIGSKPVDSLFPGAVPTPTTADWRARHAAAASDAGTSGVNILSKRIWDPASEHFDKEYYFDPVLENYFCPFQACELRFLCIEDHIKHIQLVHYVTDRRCVKCLKLFTTVAGLMRHCEMSQRCTIANTDRYAEFVDVLTGGFITADEEQRDDIPTKVLEGKTYELENGYKYTTTSVIAHKAHTYTTSKPPDWESIEEAGHQQAKADRLRGDLFDPNEHVRAGFAGYTHEFSGGRIGPLNAFSAAANNVVGASNIHTLDQDGVVRTQHPDHQQCSINIKPLDPKKEGTRRLWSGLVKNTQGQEEYADLISQCGTVSLAAGGGEGEWEVVDRVDGWSQVAGRVKGSTMAGSMRAISEVGESVGGGSEVTGGSRSGWV